MKDENKEKVLILGAGLMQRPSIEAALSLGYEVHVADANSEAVCASFADVFVPIDLKDKKSLLEYAQTLMPSLKAVFTAGTDFSASVSYVAEHLNLPCHTFEAAENASNKILMRQCFKKNNIPSPCFEDIHRQTISEQYLANGKINSMQYPKVVKPVDNMGARGCRLIRNSGEFLEAAENAVNCSRTSSAILEDYMEGPEFSIDAIIYKGTFTVTGFADRHIFYPPYFIEKGHTMPSSIQREKKIELIKTFARAAFSLGLTLGAAKADIKWTKKGPAIGEIAGRLSGGYMSGWTYPYASGLDLTKQALLVSLGKEPEELIKRRTLLSKDKEEPFEIYEVSCNSFSAERAWISIPGVVREVLGIEKAMAAPFVKNVFSRSYEGSAVDFPRNNVEKCGNVISLAQSREAAEKSAERAVSSIVLRLEKGRRRTEKFLNGFTRNGEEGFPSDAFILPCEIKEKFMDFSSKAEKIPENAPVSQIIPDFLKPYADNLKDWNFRSIRQTLYLFDSILKEHAELDGKKFWKYLIRGSIQGILFLADSSR